MRRIDFNFFLLAFLVSFCLTAQISADCVTAIPICDNTPVNGGTNGFGVDDFNGASSTGCLERSSAVIESNSAWYRFRTGASGLLGFNIGVDTSEDWDFALYKTNDCADLGEPVRCNFFDNNDEDRFIGVGEDPTGNFENIQYEDWLTVAPGEDYYLLINNFSNVNSGFSIQFSGEIFITNPTDALDCSIISNLLGPPISACNNETVVLDASASMATDYEWYIDEGAGFQLIPAEVNATLEVSISALYRVVPIGTNELSEVQVFFSQAPTAFALSHDETCSSDVYDLSLRTAEVLGGQNPDDFVVTYHTSQADADAGINPIPEMYDSDVPGIENIYARVTSVENNNCFALSDFELTTIESPILSFPEEVFICANESSVVIGELIENPDFEYLWSSGETTSSISVSEANTYTLTVTNNLEAIPCVAERSVTLVVSSPPVISDIEIEDLQSSNTITVFTEVEDEWEYQLDDEPFQSQNVFVDVLPGVHTITVNDPEGCGSVGEQVVVVGFSNFFTPNGDGINDFWNISGISILEDPVVHIYDRYGTLLAQLQSNSLGWDGTYNGRMLPSTDYWFKLTYLDGEGETAEAKYINNHFSLKR